MAKLGLLLTLGPFQFENWDTAASLAEAALDKGHEVSVISRSYATLDAIQPQDPGRDGSRHPDDVRQRSEAPPHRVADDDIHGCRAAR